MNMVVNARDAMPRGGTLQIETSNVELDSSFVAEHLRRQRGLYVMLAITDTGTGMSDATRARIFEPFFTTKEKGKGTGLGLSTVFGIVKQSRGHVCVHSVPETGTRFEVFLPRTDRAVEVSSQLREPASLRGSETILLVEDDERVRVMSAPSDAGRIQSARRSERRRGVPIASSTRKSPSSQMWSCAHERASLADDSRERPEMPRIYVPATPRTRRHEACSPGPYSYTEAHRPRAPPEGSRVLTTCPAERRKTSAPTMQAAPPKAIVFAEP